MEINPISEDLIKQNQENKNALNLEITNQPQDQRSVNKTIANESSAPALESSNNINNSPPINNVNKETAEANRTRNELLAINIFAVLGIVTNSILLTNTFLNATNMTALSVNSFFSFCDFLLYIFILRKSDTARKIAIFFACLALFFYLILIVLTGLYSKSILDSVPNIFFAIFGICFLNSKRIKRHFA